MTTMTSHARNANVPLARVALTAALAWLALAAGGVLNGGFRQLVLAPWLGERLARIASIVLLLAIVLGISAWVVARKWRALRYPALLTIGAAWAAGSILFEFGLGRLVFDMPWSELLAAYDLLAGQYWVLAPVAMLLGPALAKAALARRAPAGGE